MRPPLRYHRGMNILIVLTSNDRFGDSDKPTGFWLEELAAPYYVFADAGANITLASPQGGRPPMDPASDEPDARTPATERFKSDDEAQARLAATHRLADLDPATFDAVFYPGGHGPLWDLADDEASIALIERMYAANKPVASVCHGPAVLRRTRKANGEPLVSGRRVTAFTDSEEEAVGLTDAVAFSVEQVLREHGAQFSNADDWQPHAVVDGNLVTGQNPASSVAVAEAVLAQLR